MVGDKVCIKGPAVSGTQVDQFSLVTHNFEITDVREDEEIVCGLLEGDDNELCVSKEAVFDCGGKETRLFDNGVVIMTAEPNNRVERLAHFSDGLVEKARQKLLSRTPKEERASLDLNELLSPQGYRELKLLDFNWESYDLGGWAATLFDYQHRVVYYVFLPQYFTAGDVSKGIHQAIAHKQMIGHLLGK